jgi:four helix bundle protein
MFRFEKLDVWHKAIELTDRVYVITRAFPDIERFGLTSQMRRAAVSISSNIAEGSSRLSTTEFLRFIEIAYGSLMELITQALVAKRQDFLSEAHYADVFQHAEQLSKMLSGLRSSLSPKKQP